MNTGGLVLGEQSFKSPAGARHCVSLALSAPSPLAAQRVPGVGSLLLARLPACCSRRWHLSSQAGGLEGAMACRRRESGGSRWRESRLCVF